jgi:hypothetical protein
MNKQKASNLIINIIKGLSNRYKLPLETISPKHLAMLIHYDVPEFKIKRFITDRFEEKNLEEKKCLDAGFDEKSIRMLDEIEVYNLCGLNKK